MKQIPDLRKSTTTKSVCNLVTLIMPFKLTGIAFIFMCYIYYILWICIARKPSLYDSHYKYIQSRNMSGLYLLCYAIFDTETGAKI